MSLRGYDAWKTREPDDFSYEPRCDTCGRPAADCACPECPVCGEAGNLYCYNEGHLSYTRSQMIGRAKARIDQLQTELDDEKYALFILEQENQDASQLP